MASPTPSDVHVSVPLTNISLAWVQDQGAYVADQVFPNVPVQKQYDVYFTYNQDDFLRDEAQLRAPGTESAGDGYRITSTATYRAEVRALHRDIDDFVRTNADTPLDMDRDASIFLTQRMMINRELFWATKYFTTGVWTGGPSASDWLGTAGAADATHFKQWDLAGSTPVEDITNQMDVSQANTAYRPNVLVLGAQVFTSLKNNAELLDRIKYGGGPANPATVDEQALAQVFGVQKVLVSRATSNTAAEAAAGTYAFIAGKNALLAYVPAAPSLLTPSAGYTFSWVGYYGASNMGLRMKRFRIDRINSDRIEAEMAYDMQVVSSIMGTFFSAAHS